MMADGELEFSNQEMLSSSNFGEFSSSMDSFFNEILKDTHACTHAHTCNPPGPDNSHTHTCYHVHTKIVPPSEEEDEDKNPSDDTAESSEKKGQKRPVGNKEAVRKYREKKKARAASLEDEVIRLRAINQQLFKRLQGQAVLEAEVARLKCLLVDIRGRIEGEIGSFPYQKPIYQKPMKSGNLYQNVVNPNIPGSYVVNSCNLQCDDQVYCLHPGAEVKSSDGTVLNGQGFNNCEFETLQCLGNQTSGIEEVPCPVDNGTPIPTANTSGRNKRKGGARITTAS